MTEHDKQQTTSDLSPRHRSDQRGILASPLRRRLVKGTALALPAIITLPRAEAQAMASATCAMREGARNGGQPAGVDLVRLGDDTYHREPVQVRDVDNTLASGKKIYFDSYVNFGAGAWRIFGDPTLDGTIVQSGLNPDPGGSPLNGYYALAFVGGNGQIVALAPGISPSAAVSDNCFASI